MDGSLCRLEEIKPGQLALHADNGGPMIDATMLATLQILGVMASFSRSRVSDDTPYVKALFPTLMYRPEYPRRPFATFDKARQGVAGFVQWYNIEHATAHSGLSLPQIGTLDAMTYSSESGTRCIKRPANGTLGAGQARQGIGPTSHPWC